MSIVPFNLQKNLIVNASGNMMCIDARQPFTFKINTIYGNSNNTFALPLSTHTTNLKIETSDGQSITITNYADSAKLIQFPSAGVYTIKMRGECGWSFNNAGDCQKLIGISNWGGAILKFNYFINAFNGCINLGLNEGLPINGYIGGERLISLENAFRSCNLKNLNNGTMLHMCKLVGSLSATFFTNKITSVHADLLKYQTKVGLFTSTFENNLLESLPDNFFKTCEAARSFYGVLAFNRFKTLPNYLFYYNKNVTNYNYALYKSFTSDAIKLVVPDNMFDLSVLNKVTTFGQMMYQNATINSPTGTVQDIWDYASPTATKTDCFQNCAGLTNYDDIPTDWI